MTGKTEKKTLFPVYLETFFLFQPVVTIVLMGGLIQPQLLVSSKSLFTDNHPSLLLPRPTNKAINVSPAVSYIYKVYPPSACRQVDT